MKLIIKTMDSKASVASMYGWLDAHWIDYEFTPEEWLSIKFPTEEEAVIFKLMFGV